MTEPIEHMKHFDNRIQFNEMGININRATSDVEFAAAHVLGVDSSLKNKPVIDTTTIPGTTIYSIFQRNDKLALDGNPLIYALKGDSKWWMSDENKNKLLARINEVIDKFCQMHPSDFTIVVPSHSRLNSTFGKMIHDSLMRVGKQNIVIENLLVKMTVDEVEDEMLKEDSPFVDEFGDDIDFVWNELRESFSRMEDENDGIFSYKMVKPPMYRKYILKTLKYSDEEYARELASKMPGKNILIIDDTVTFGRTLNNAVELTSNMRKLKRDVDSIEEMSPRSISILTLMSVKKKLKSKRKRKRN